MRIKSLEITGFKSFVDKAVFQFESGITGIVGPNGCGKSNVVDAIRWSMGEQSPRRLRGKGMEDVIFAGSDARAPVGLAEVTLTFDNSEGKAPPTFAAYSEIQVSRRLYRSGESEYRLNKVTCRLRDVQDFFRDTGIGTKGYTIVEQGRIAEIVSAKPEERRMLIEEAAGISKYKARRREAERKLEATDQNLLRVNDVLGEIKRQISSIERQARKAARYKRLRETQRLLDLSLSADERSELLEEIETARRHGQELRDEATRTETQLAEQEAALEEKRVDLTDHERLLSEGGEALFEVRTRIQELESRISYERRERASLAEANVAREREREQLAAQRRETEEACERHRDELRAVETALASDAEVKLQAESEVEAATVVVRDLEQRRDEANQRLVEVLTSTARAEDRRSERENRSAEIDRRLRSADEQLEVQSGEVSRADREQQALEEGLRNLLAERDRMMGALRAALERHERCNGEARDAAQGLLEVRERREARRARLESLREVVERREDVEAGARHLLEGDAGRHGIQGLVRDLIEVEHDVEHAVEAALADRGAALVIDGTRGLLSALEDLRRGDVGRALLVLRPEQESLVSGVVPLGEPLLGHVRTREGFESIVQRLLGGVQLVDDLAEAVERYGQGTIPCTFVSRSGELLTPEGVVRAGRPERGPGREVGALARQRELRELAVEVDQLELEFARREASLRAAEAQQTQASDELENLRNRHHTAALAVANHEKDLERTRERFKALGEAREGRAQERSGWLAESDALAEEVVRLEVDIQEGRESRAQQQRALDALVLELGSAARDQSRVEGVAAERRVQHASREETRDRVREALERAEQGLTESAAWIERREAEIRSADQRREELAQSISGAELELASELEHEEQARRTNEEKREVYEAVAESVRVIDEESRRLRNRLHQHREQVQQADLGLRETELRLDHLETQVRDRWAVELASWKVPVPALEPGEPIASLEPEAPAEADAESGAGENEPLDRDAQREARANAELLAQDRPSRRKHLEDVRKKIEAIGEVNLGAIEEHEELRERYRFLAEQKTDLETSVAQLRDAIARINRTSRKRFRETFEAIDEKFRKNFPRMFRGGKAQLSLTEHEDVLEAGIEIMAQPPGKRLQSVNLLSGGEKTMTALALLVSVFQVRPSPFFLLDEVDAALDDANVGRFNELVVELARDSQFLLITHNKRTIEVADVLYGVTMEEKGASKLVSVALH